MADEHAVEPPPGTPGQRALGAMESAVRRARESAGTPVTPPEPVATSARRTAPAEIVQPEQGVQPREGDLTAAGVRRVGDVRILDGAQPLDGAPRREDTLQLPATDAGRASPANPSPANRWLIGSVVLVAALVVAAAIALVVSLSGSSPPSRTAADAPHTGTPPARTPTTASPRNGTPTTTATTTATTTPTTASPSTSTSSTAGAVSPGGPPTIEALSPATGRAGQSVTVTGTNFLSSSGQIVATFNGQVAPTSCPAQNTCSITVPSSTSPTAQVVITTSGGASNAMTFTYG